MARRRTLNSTLEQVARVTNGSPLRRGGAIRQAAANRLTRMGYTGYYGKRVEPNESALLFASTAGAYKKGSSSYMRNLSMAKDEAKTFGRTRRASIVSKGAVAG